MKAKLNLVTLLVLIFVSRLALAGHADGAEAGRISRTGDEGRIICEYALSGKLANGAMTELNAQFFERPFTVYHHFEDRTKAALQELGMEWLKESQVDHLILKALLGAEGVKMDAGLLVDGKWVRVLEIEYVPDDPALWREMQVKSNEVKLSYDEITGIYPSREPNFKSQFPHPVGFHTAANNNGVRKYLAIGDLDFDNVETTIGIDVMCNDIKKYVTLGREDFPLRLKTETQQYCRIPVLTFVRPRIHHNGHG